MIAFALLIVGITILFFVDKIIDKNTSDSTLQFMYQNKTMIGSLCVAAAYYSYLQAQKGMNVMQEPLRVPRMIPELPSYDSLDTSEVLNISHDL